MKIRMPARIALLLLLAVAMATAAQADTIRLKNGTVIKGKVINFANNSFTVALDLGSGGSSRAIFDLRDIESIEFDGQTESASARPPAATIAPRPSAPDDDNGHVTTAAAKPAPAPKPAPRPAPQPTTTSAPSNVGSTQPGKELVANVSAKADWTYANMIVKPGDRIHISASGKIKLSPAQESGPDGVNIEDKEKLILDKPTGGLIAVIGDDNDDFIFIGREREFVATRAGKLFLGVNEGQLGDNEGAFNVRLSVSGGDERFGAGNEGGEVRPASASLPNRPAAKPPAPEATNAANTIPKSGAASPLEASLDVPAKDSWTYSSLTVHRGDRIHISASGKVKLSATQQSGHEGIKLEDKEKLILDKPTGALIAVIGDDNDDFIFVGRDSDFVAQHDGRLFLSVNEGELSDNDGAFTVRVKVEPGH